MAASNSGIRFSLRSLMLGTALVVIGLSFLRSEGCSGRWQTVTNLAYSPDGTMLAVCSYECGDANVSMKAYVADMDRFITVYRIASGREEIVQRDFRGGDLGPGISNYCYAPLQFSSD